MTGAPISDLSNMFFGSKSVNVPVTNADGGNFGKELNRIGLKNDSNAVQDLKDKDSGQKHPTKFNETGKMKENLSRDTKEIDSSDKTASVESDEKPIDGSVKERPAATETEQENELLKRAEEVVQTLFCQVADVLGISQEELSNLMQQVGFEKEDLLSTDNLNQLALMISGVEDTLQLVTDENLYQQVKEFQDTLSETVASLTDDFPISDEEIRALLQTSKSVEYDEGRVVTVLNQTPMESMEEGSKTEEVHLEQRVEFDETTDTVDKNAHADTDENSSKQMKHEEQNTQPQSVVSFTQTVSGIEEISFSKITVPISETESIMNQITEYIKVNVKPDLSEIQMKLQPENLGTVHVQLVAKEGTITARFTTENEMVKSVLESQMIQLKENFEEQGIQVEAVEVTVGNPGFDNQSKQESAKGNESDRPAKSTVRRINLSQIDSLEQLSDEEQIEVEMMVANGSTVDYMA